jgi:hypothetical protein
MDFEHVNIKLSVEGPKDAEGALEPLIPIFHRWIQQKVFDELLLDIADYRHVYAGPGVVLIGHQADYAVDNTDNKLGLLYNRKTVFEGSNQDRFKQATRSALNAIHRLEAEPTFAGKIHFDGKSIELFINDRFLAPNKPETRTAFEPELKQFAETLFGGKEYSAEYESDPRRRFGVTLKPAHPVSAQELLANLS